MAFWASLVLRPGMVVQAFPLDAHKTQGFKHKKLSWGVAVQGARGGRGSSGPLSMGLRSLMATPAQEVLKAGISDFRFQGSRVLKT